MTIRKQEFLDHTRLDEATLEFWIEEQWLLPNETAADLVFSEADLARADLIQNLKHDLGVNDEGVGIILNLLDQVHGLRRVIAQMLQSARERPTMSQVSKTQDQNLE